MRIGIDIQTTLGEKTGFGFYVSNLVKHLKDIDNSNKYLLFKPETEEDFSAPQRFIWDQVKFPKLAKKNKVDILHQPCFSAPIFHDGMKIVVTIHDLIAIRFGKDIPFYSRQYFGRWMPFSYRYADEIIAVSEYTKKDIIKLLNIPDKKITVIPLAVDDCFKEIHDKEVINAVKNKYHITGNYLLHLGTINPRKNLEFLIEVFSALEDNNLKLVITGKKGWYYEGLFDLVKKLGLEDRVIFTGYIDDEDKPALYNGASIFLFPSIYEGFGLPPLEAMACGTPVICSNTSSIPEVVGSAGILISPTDKLCWVREIKKVLEDKQIYNALSKKALIQATKFSWDRCAKQTIQIYEKLYHEK